MKALLFSAVWGLSVLLLHAQRNSTNPNFPRSGDVLHYLEFEAGDVAVEHDGEELVWDFSKTEMTDNGKSVSFVADSKHPFVMAAVDGNTRIYYAENARDIVCPGFENNRTKVEYDVPIVVLPRSATMGSGIEGAFHGIGMYSETAMMRVCGTFSSTVDGRGTLILPDGKKLENVFRVYSRKRERGIVCPGIQTRGELMAYVDSIRPFNADSITACLKDKPDGVVHTETLRWYAPGYRYPIIEITSYSTGSGKPYARKARCFTPGEQGKLYDPENESIRLTANGLDKVAKSSEENASGTDTVRPYSIAKDGNEIAVSPDGQNRVVLRVLLADSSGIVFKTVSSNGGAPAVINCSGLHRGEYILYIETDGVAYSEKVEI